MASALDIVAMWISPVRAVRVSLGPLNVLIVIGDFLKMLSMVRMTLTCVVTRMLVPRMDLGATLLTLKFDGNTATYPDVLQEVFMYLCKILIVSHLIRINNSKTLAFPAWESLAGPRCCCFFLNNNWARYLPENQSFHTFNLCLIVVRFYIYIAAKESEPYSFLAFKAFLKYKLSI